MSCPSCGNEGSGGAHCAACGAPLAGARCRACDEALVPGARYCTRCGRAARHSGNLPWYVAGGAVAALLAFLAIGAAGSGDATGPAAPVVPTGLGPGPTSLTGTPREQADRLFNRVMQAEAAGDTTEVGFFLPMAIEAYHLAGPLDADGLYHLSVLQLAAGDAAAAAETAAVILRDAPTHLLALGAAADAASAMGDTAAARAHSERLIAAFEAETETGRPEYMHHEAMLAVYRDAAATRTGAGR